FAEAEGADYVGVGPVYPTGTKSDTGAVLGLDGLRRVVSHASLPCVAIGGITAENAEAVTACGVAGCCVISGILGQSDIARAMRTLRDAVERGRQHATGRRSEQ
ncbi:MAG: thiamine phosphate synthase, partial [Candidatus Pacebacteria bacterium]|nr:thiamine phosphate synthase [Candidatus Paceibacterota bacterium]